MENDGRLTHVRSYWERSRALQEVLRDQLEQKIGRVLDLFLDAWKRGKTIFVMGNGGSASTASHFANDLAKGTIVEGKPRVRVIALTDNVPVMLAWANDASYEHIFVEQLKNLMQPGDLVVGLSGSGNSPNVLAAIEYANRNGAITLGLVGFDGGKLLKIARHSLHAPTFHMGQAEDAHLAISHLITDIMKKEIEHPLASAQPPRALE